MKMSYPCPILEVMEQENTDHITEIRSTMPKREANTSLILNGIGNGMMIGTFPFVTMETYSHLANWKVPKQAYALNAAALLGGSMLGAMYGLKEAHKLQNYRESLVDEVEGMRNKIDENCTKIDSWVERLEAERRQPSKGRSV